MKDVNFNYTHYRKIQLAKSLMPAVIGLAVGVVSLWTTSTSIGEDRTLTIIDTCFDKGYNAMTATEKETGITRRYFSERVED